MPVPAIFYAHRCESPPKSTNQVGRFYHMTFQNVGHDRGKWPGRRLGMKLKCQIAAIGVKNRPVCPHQSMAKFAAIFAGDQIRCDRRIKSPGVSPALTMVGTAF